MLFRARTSLQQKNYKNIRSLPVKVIILVCAIFTMHFYESARLPFQNFPAMICVFTKTSHHIVMKAKKHIINVKTFV